MNCLRGLNTAIYVLAATVLLLVLTSCGSDGGADPKPLKEGRRLTTGDTVETEVGSVTIRSYEVLVTGEDDEVQPPAGFIFAVIEMEGCVTRPGVVTIYADDVQLELIDGTRLIPTRAAREPALPQRTNVQSGNCARGFPDLRSARAVRGNLRDIRSDSQA